jgi:hypothetical protein
MSDTDLSISAISNQKLENYGQKAEVAVLKKSLDQEGEIGAKLIESAILPEGKGGRINIAA